MEDNSNSNSYSYFNRQSSTSSSYDSETEREAIKLLKSQNNKIIELTFQLEKKAEMIALQKDQIVTLTEKLSHFEDSFFTCEKMKEQFNIFLKEKEAMRNKLYAKDKLLNELQTEFNEITMKFNSLNEQIASKEASNDKIAQLVELIKQYSHDITETTQKNKLYQAEVNKLNKELEQVMKSNQKNGLYIQSMETSAIDEINAANKDINLLVQWIDSYMGVYFDVSVEIPEVPSFCQSSSKINFELLRTKINSTRRKINETQLQYESTIQKLNNDNLDLITQTERTSKELSSSKADIIKLQGEVDDLRLEDEKAENRIQSLSKEYKKKEESLYCFLMKMNRIILKLKRDNKDYQEIQSDNEVYNVFERNFSSLIEHIIDIENQNELLIKFRKDSITIEEFSTIKAYYQNQISQLEKTIKENIDYVQMQKEENEHLLKSIEVIEREKNKLLQDNFQLIKLKQSNRNNNYA